MNTFQTGKFFFFSFVLSLLFLDLCAQSSTLGREFYVGFMDNHSTPNSVPPRRDKAIVIITANEKASGIIRTPKQSLAFSLEKGQQFIREFDGEEENLIVRTSGEKEAKSMRITSSGDIAVHAINGREYSSDATVILPVSSLGKEYMVMAHFDVFGPDQSPGGNRNFESTLLVVAIENDTRIEIIPAAQTVNTIPAGAPIFITLNQGDSYQIKGLGDLTGSRVRVTNDAIGDCKNIAVFGGNKMTSAGDCGSTGDHLYQQTYPTNTWGKSYVHIPWKQRSQGEIVKVLASQNKTEVRVNGQLKGIIDAGKFLRFELGKEEVASISTSKPTSVAVIPKSGFCSDPGAAALGDPSLLTYSPNSQRIKSIIFSAGKLAGGFNQDIEHYLNIIVPQGSQNLTILNGQNIGSQFKPVPGVDFVFAQVRISKFVNTLINQDGFIGYAYGSGSIESYAFAVGAQLDNIQYEIQTNYSFFTDGEKTACLNQKANWKILPENLSLKEFEWDFGDGSPSVKGQEVGHTFSRQGQFRVQIRASAATGKCDQEEIFSFEVEVNPTSALLSGPISVCPQLDQITYQLKDKIGFQKVNWSVLGGDIISQSDSTVLVNWGKVRPDAYIEAVPISDAGCPGDSIRLDVDITASIAPKAPIGAKGICGNSNPVLRYTIPVSALDRSFFWIVEGGDIVSGQNSEAVEVQWNQAMTGSKSIYFEEISNLDGICGGVSERLEIELYPELTFDMPEIQNPGCQSILDGSIKLMPIGGSGIYEFDWSHDANLNSNIAPNLGAGLYAVIVRDLSGCDEKYFEIELEFPQEIELKDLVQEFPVSCFGAMDGRISFELTGGNPPFAVSGQNSRWDGRQLIVSDLAKGNYFLDVVDVRGCVFSVSAEIDGPEELFISFQELNPGCPGGFEGRLEVIPVGGNAPYSFLWEDGSSFQDIGQLAAGSYQVTVIDANGCVITGKGNVSEAVPQVRMPSGYLPKEGNLIPVSNCAIAFELSIWDRWGELVYVGKEGWSGEYKGQEVPVGVYSFSLRYEYLSAGQTNYSIQKGSFTLIR